jgi:HlyD family secretion protein
MSPAGEKNRSGRVTYNPPGVPALSVARKRIVALGFVLAAGIGGWYYANRGPRPIEVQVAKVERQDLQAKVSANGKVQAQKKVDISATVPGQVTRIAVEEGDAVRKGQFLLQIDPVNTRAAAKSAEASILALRREAEAARASLVLARADFERARSNFDAGIIPAADLERARTALATGEAALLAAERRVDQASAAHEGAAYELQRTTVRAPMDGIVTAKRVEEGEVAVVGVLNQPGTVLLQISDMSVVETEMEVDETSIPSVKLDQDALVRIDAYPNRTFPGVVTEVGSSPIVRSGSNAASEAIKFKVKIELRDPPPGVKPGLSVQADILTGFRAQALVIPIQALVVRDIERKPGEPIAPGAPREEEGVYLLEAGKARFQRIVTGLLGELSLEVLEGLAGGETVISGPFRALRTLRPGDRVAIEKPERGGSAAEG